MIGTGETSHDSSIGAGTPRGDAARSAPAVPHGLDVLGRELIALRAGLVAQLALIDAALTSFRVLQVAADAAGTAEPPRAQTTGNDAIAAELIDRIRRGGKSTEPPRTFGDRLTREPDPRTPPESSADGANDGVARLDNVDAADESAEGLHVPPMGGEVS